MSNQAPVVEAVEECCALLRRRQLEGSLPCAKKAADIMRLVITKKYHPDASSLIDDVRAVGYKLQSAKPVELAIGNVVRRVLHLIREEQKREQTEVVTEEKPTTSSITLTTREKQQLGLLSQALKLGRGPSLSNLLEGIEDVEKLIAPILEASAAQEQADNKPDVDVESHASTKKPRQKGQPQWKGKQEVIDSLNELIDELENIQTSITAQGVEHIHANEVILTFGMSDTTYLFLKEASKKREFQVVVAEGAPKYDGHLMARKLADAGIQATLISDSAIFAMMARANKVLVGAHAVLANGGVVAPVGMHMVALAAKRHSIPFVVLVGLHKLSPLFPHDTDLTYNDFKSPADVVDYDVVAEVFSQQEAMMALNYEPPATTPASGSGPAQRGGDPLGGNLHIPNPSFDYVPPHLISLFITDNGGHTPSYVYRLLTEYYSREDYLLSKALQFGQYQ